MALDNHIYILSKIRWTFFLLNKNKYPPRNLMNAAKLSKKIKKKSHKNGETHTFLINGFFSMTRWSPAFVILTQLIRARVVSLPLAFEVIFIRISSDNRLFKGLSTMILSHGRISLFTASLSDKQTTLIARSSNRGRWASARNKASCGGLGSSSLMESTLEIEDEGRIDIIFMDVSMASCSLYSTLAVSISSLDPVSRIWSSSSG